MCDQIFIAFTAYFRAVSTEFFHFVFTADEDTLKVSLQFCPKWAGVG